MVNMSDTTLFVEETMPDGRYEVVWRGKEPASSADDAMQVLVNHVSPNRLELWSRAWAGCDKGFAPMAFREAGSDRVKVGTTFRMLCLDDWSAK